MSSQALGPPGTYQLQLRLPVFEGPLDVLLRLIEREQLAITDVSLVAVTDQFMARMAGLSDVPAEVFAEFAAVAARLLVLKSRSLLPVQPKEAVDPVPDDLTARLVEYQEFKTAARYLREREESDLRSFSPLAVSAGHVTVTERLTAPPVAALPRALSRCLRRGPSSAVVHRPRPVITLGSMMRRIISRLRTGRGSFVQLVGDQADRVEYVVGFLALLTLLRQRVLTATQPSLFGEIVVERCASPDGVRADD